MSVDLDSAVGGKHELFFVHVEDISPSPVFKASSKSRCENVAGGLRYG